MPFDFSTPKPLAEAVRDLSRKTPIGAALSSRQWEKDVPEKLRADAMFSARVQSARVMQEMKDRLVKLAQNVRDASGAYAQDRGKFIAEMQALANAHGLRTQEQEKRGSVQDFGSERRLRLILEQQIGAAQGKAFWLQGQDPDVLDAWPAQELVRIRKSKVERDWKKRWTAAGGPPSPDGRLIALKTDPVWANLSRFDRPYPPFDYGSGMGIEEIDREEAEARGLLRPGEVLEPGVDAFERAQEASVRGLDPEMREALKKSFGGQIEMDGEAVRWREPDQRGALPEPPLATAPVADKLSKYGSDHPRRPHEELLNDLGGSLPSGGRVESDEGPERDAVFRAEERALRESAEERSLLAPVGELIPASPDDGREHRVRYDPEEGVYRKSTHPGSYGGFMGVGYELDAATQKWLEKPLVLQATPREYLERVRLTNEVFNDDIQITKVIDTAEGLSIETTQPAVRGRPATPNEIRSEMEALGFVQVHADGVFYRATDGVMVWDLEGNALITEGGAFAPIDAMLRRAPQSLADKFQGS